jgi:cyclohexa-1,5-dienecarbonyl-CoA hydratase
MAKIRPVPLWDGAGLKLVLDAPKANVLDAEMMAEIRGHLRTTVPGTPGLKLIVFEGEGSHFCFGASVKEHQREQAAQMLAGFHGMFLDLIELAVPTAAVVRGQCLGGGMELAIFCHWIFASPSARFGQPEIQLGVFPPPASVILPLKLGQAAADHLCLSGESWTAEQARAAGLVHEVADDPMVALDAFFDKHLKPKSASSLRMATRAVRNGFHQTLRQQLPALERLYVDELMATHDANEGIAAFLEKRSPVWDK